MTAGTFLLMVLGFIGIGLGGLKVRARVIDRRLSKEYPEKK